MKRSELVFAWIRKVVPVWILALLLAAPELLLKKNSSNIFPVDNLTSEEIVSNFTINISSLQNNTDYRQLRLVYSNYLSARNKNQTSHFSVTKNLLEDKADHTESFYNSSVGFRFLFRVCNQIHSQNKTFSEFIQRLTTFGRYRHWWYFLINFLFPVFVSLLLLLYAIKKLENTVKKYQMSLRRIYPASYYLVSKNEANFFSSYSSAGDDLGLLGRRRNSGQNTPATPKCFVEQASFSDTDRCSTHKEQNEQQKQRILLQKQISLTPSVCRHNHWLSPMTYYQEYDEKSISSFDRLSFLNNFSQHQSEVSKSSMSPSLLGASRTSVVSLTNSNTVGSVECKNGCRSFPLHGHGRKKSRRRRQTAKLILNNIAEQKKWFSATIATVLIFAVTQFPGIVVEILIKENLLISYLAEPGIELAIFLVHYLFCLTFILNPLILGFCFTMYKHFLASCLRKS